MHSSELDSITWKLMAPTRALESTFRAWSLGDATESEVSDQYVRLGNEFIAARTRLANGGLAVDDLIDVPQKLRGILENALALDCSPEVAEQYDPQIRAVMTQLFHQLKAKQLQLVSQQSRAQQIQQSQSPHVNAQPTTYTANQPMHHPPHPSHLSNSQHRTQAEVPAHDAQRSMNYPRSRPMHSHSYSQSGPGSSGSSSGVSGTGHSAAPSGGPIGAGNNTAGSVKPHSPSIPNSGSNTESKNALSPNPPPIPAPKRPNSVDEQEDDALSLLQRHGALERQASKRYSTRQISRMMNGTHTSEQMSLPTSGVHKTFSAPEYTDSNVFKEGNSHRSLEVHAGNAAQGISHSHSGNVSLTLASTPEDGDAEIQQNAIPEQSQRRRTSSSSQRSARSSLRRSSNGSNTNSPSKLLDKITPGAPGSAGGVPPAQSGSASISSSKSQGEVSISPRQASRMGSPAQQHHLSARPSRRSVSIGSPNPAKSILLDEEFPVFLRLGNNIRKATLAKPVSIAAIRLRFVEVCAYMHSGDDTFPEITLQDPQTNINYEITEATVSDVVEGSLLTLKVKTAEEISMEDKLKEIKESIADLSTKIRNGGASGSAGVGSAGSGVAGAGGNTPGTSMMRGNSTANKSTFSSPHLPQHSSKFASPVLTGDGKFKLERPPAPPRELPIDKVDIVHREIAVIRQLSNKTIHMLKAEVEKLRKEVKELSTASGANFESDRRAMNIIKQQLDNTSQNLLSQMENLSDVIDAQRVGIGSHGVRYPQKEMEKVRKQLNAWSAEFQKSEELIQNEKPVWKKTWQTELNNVIEDQEWLKSLDMLYSDLRADLEQTVSTFELVCEANALPRKPGLRQGLPMAPPIKPGEEKIVADAVFHEISALNLNHEQRAEAAQRAERLHKAKLALRSEEFEDELNTFVVDAKLKPNGGFEEVERRIREREALARKEAEKSEQEARLYNEKIREERRAKRRGADPVSSKLTDENNKLNSAAKMTVEPVSRPVGEPVGEPATSATPTPANLEPSNVASALSNTDIFSDSKEPPAQSVEVTATSNRNPTTPSTSDANTISTVDTRPP